MTLYFIFVVICTFSEQFAIANSISDQEFLHGTRHAIDSVESIQNPKSKISNPCIPRIYLAQVNPKSKISNLKSNDQEFLDGTRHAIDPWNQSKISNLKSSSPRIYLAQVNPKSKISNLKSNDQEFLDGTRHAIDPWNQSKISNRKSQILASPEFISRKSIQNLKSQI